MTQRIEHAVALQAEHPDWSYRQIAAACGLSQGYVHQKLAPSRGCRGCGAPPNHNSRWCSDACRFWHLVGPGEPDACWNWTRATNGAGYGKFMTTGKVLLYAHRCAYEYAIGPIPEGLQLDHLCRNRACVNPAHLEPVTGAENTRRGFSPTAINARKTHCIRGHELAGENLHVGPKGGRYCRACNRLRLRRQRGSRNV